MLGLEDPGRDLALDLREYIMNRFEIRKYTRKQDFRFEICKYTRKQDFSNLPQLSRNV